LKLACRRLLDAPRDRGTVAHDEHRSVVEVGALASPLLHEAVHLVHAPSLDGLSTLRYVL
jgi:hypothetical protein